MKILVLALLIAFHFSSFALCVSASRANLRSGPGAKYPISWTVPKYMALLDVERKGPWIKVKDVDGVYHWVHTKLVSSSIQCVVVKAKEARLRTGPGTKYPTASMPLANRYFAYRKVDSEDEWIMLKHDIYGTFWIHENLVWKALKVQAIGF